MLEPIKWATSEQQRELRLQIFLHQIMLGLQAGLSGFYQRDIRVAVILGVQLPYTVDNLRIYDLHGLLNAWRPFIENKFSAENRIQLSDQAHSTDAEITVARISERAITLEFRGSTGLYQFWLVEVPVQNGSFGIAEEWTRYAGSQLHNEKQFEAAPTSIEFVIPSIGTTIVRLAIMRQLFGANRQFELERVMEALLRISAMKEEGKLSVGRVAICDEEVNPSIRFESAIDLSQAKHARKLLRLSGDESPLLCSGTSIIGLCRTRDELPPKRLDAFFRSGSAIIELNGQPLCRIYRDRVRCAAIRVDRSFFKRFIPTTFPARNGLTDHVAEIADGARSKGFGCTIVLDLDQSCKHLTGQDLVDPLPLGEENNGLIEKMCGIDGAVLIDAKSQTVKSFGCLLDGMAVTNEDRSRGARHTSALRFSNEHRTVAIIVVSEDGPVSAYQNGQQHHESHTLAPSPVVQEDAPSIRDWLNGRRSAHMHVYS